MSAQSWFECKYKLNWGAENEAIYIQDPIWLIMRKITNTCGNVRDKSLDLRPKLLLQEMFKIHKYWNDRTVCYTEH